MNPTPASPARALPAILPAPSDSKQPVPHPRGGKGAVPPLAALAVHAQGIDQRAMDAHRFIGSIATDAALAMTAARAELMERERCGGAMQVKPWLAARVGLDAALGGLKEAFLAPNPTKERCERAFGAVDKAAARHIEDCAALRIWLDVMCHALRRMFPDFRFAPQRTWPEVVAELCDSLQSMVDDLEPGDLEPDDFDSDDLDPKVVVLDVREGRETESAKLQSLIDRVREAAAKASASPKDDGERAISRILASVRKEIVKLNASRAPFVMTDPDGVDQRLVLHTLWPGWEADGCAPAWTIHAACANRFASVPDKTFDELWKDPGRAKFGQPRHQVLDAFRCIANELVRNREPSILKPANEAQCIRMWKALADLRVAMTKQSLVTPAVLNCFKELSSHLARVDTNRADFLAEAHISIAARHIADLPPPAPGAEAHGVKRRRESKED